MKFSTIDTFFSTKTRIISRKIPIFVIHSETIDSFVATQALVGSLELLKGFCLVYKAMAKKTYTKKEEMLNVNAIMFKCKDCLRKQTAFVEYEVYMSIITTL